MNINHYRKTLIAAGAVTVMGLGISACGNDADSTQLRTASPERSDSMSAAASDTAITTRVKARMMAESNLSSSDINVNTANGIVTLEGSVTDAAAKSSAERVARSVDGVQRISNNLTLASGSDYPGSATMNETQRIAADTWITTKVKSQLLADRISQGFEVGVETMHGVVTLDGELASQRDIDHVRSIAAGVEGVKSVNTSALVVAVADAS